jgi:predicted  nucleic acid-binding Zn-ribbon protein
MADKIEDLKNIILGDEIKRFDTKFMEFGDKLSKLSEKANSPQMAIMEEKVARLQRDVKSGFDKIIDTINAQFKRLETSIAKNTKDIEAVRKKFGAFKELFSGS